MPPPLHVLLSLLTLSALSHFRLSAITPPPPNVLLIAIDDLNDWVGPLGGHPQAQTPNLDRLAARGLTFTNAHCQAPLCNSSRTSVMTGLRPTTTGIYGLAPWFRTVPALHDLVSLPQALKRAGYRTAISGKIYHVYPPDSDKPAEFDAYGPACTFGPLPKKKFVNTPHPIPLVDWGVFPERDEQQNDFAIASYTINALKAEKNSPAAAPFFHAVGFGRPHVPCYASQKWFDLYPEHTLQLPPILENDRDDTPRFSWYLHWALPEPRLKFLNEQNQLKNLVRSYLACISYVDSEVGRVLDALEASGKADNTIIILWSDHGFHLGEKGITGKNTLWERSTRVPLILAGPGIPKNQRCAEPVELLDIYPTLLDLVTRGTARLQPGSETPHPSPRTPHLEGLSLSAQIKDPSAPRHRPAITTHNPGNHSARDREWRYIRYADGSEELYHLPSDPNEWNNLLAPGRTPTPEQLATRNRLASAFPKTDAALAPGSRERILENRNGTYFWENKPIAPDDPIPEL